jgi:ammonia channel protein AmtB
VNTLGSLSDEMTRGMDFAGGTVIHINFIALLLLVVVMSLLVWSVTKKR